MNKNLFNIVKYQVLIVMGLLTFFTFLNPKVISLSWGTSLLTMLIGLIVVRFLSLFNPKFNHYIISYVSFVLFAFFVMYDTKRLIIRAKHCIKADYINDSLGLVLDVLNIFSDLFRIQSN